MSNSMSNSTSRLAFEATLKSYCGITIRQYDAARRRRCRLIWSVICEKQIDVKFHVDVEICIDIKFEHGSQCPNWQRHNFDVQFNIEINMWECLVCWSLPEEPATGRTFSRRKFEWPIFGCFWSFLIFSVGLIRSRPGSGRLGP